MVDPASEAALKEVTEGVRRLCLTGGRKWTIIHSDGVPYVQLSEMQDDIFKCTHCEVELDKRNFENSVNFEASKEEHLRQHELTTSFVPKFDDIIILPGPGHIELNMGRKLLNLLWTPLLSDYVTALGFRSVNAQNVVRRGIDHHRTRQILQTTLDALSRELLVPYVRYCLHAGFEASTTGYTAWIENDVEDSNYLFLYHMAFMYLLAFNLYNEATCKNHGDLMLDNKFSFVNYISRDTNSGSKKTKVLWQKVLAMLH